MCASDEIWNLTETTENLLASLGPALDGLYIESLLEHIEARQELVVHPLNSIIKPPFKKPSPLFPGISSKSRVKTIVRPSRRNACRIGFCFPLRWY